MPTTIYDDTNGYELNAVNLSSLGGAFPMSQPISGNYYNGPYLLGGMGGSSTTRSIATGTLYYQPIIIHRTWTFTKVGIISAATVAGNVNLGVFASNANSRPVGSALVQSGSVAMAINSFISYTFPSPLLMPAGLYFIGLTFSGANLIYGPTGGGYEAGIARGMGLASAPTTTATDTLMQAGWSQSFTYSATLPSVGTLASYNALAGGDAYVFLQAQ